jgi:hypothetical protein
MNTNEVTTVVPLDSKRASKVSPAPLPEATSWNGEFDENALLRPGSYLVAALKRRADYLGHTGSVMATDYLGVTYGYITQLRNGKRPTKAISEEFSVKCAEYLGIPRLTVLLMAGAVTVADLYASSTVLEMEIPRALEFITQDAEWGHFLTPDILHGTLETKYLVIRLYEKATNRRLLPEQLDLDRIAEAFKGLEKERERRMKEVSVQEDGNVDD